MSDENFGAELRRIRTAAGWSLTDLSNRVHYSKGYLSKVENGVTPPNDALAALCDTELGTGGTLSAHVPRRHRKHKNRTFTLRPAGLPPTTPFFIGRPRHIAEIVAVLRGTRPGSPGVCALNGLAGSGKTALAVHVARQVLDDFPDGVLFLDLHAYTPGGAELDAAEALDRLLRQLGVPGEEIPRSPDDRAVLYRGCLHGRRLLVVIDNARAAAQVMPLIPGEPGCKMLVTSRNRLVALDDAQHISVGSLTQDEAAALFGFVAGPGRAPEDADGRRLVAEVIERCGRLPLAVRIAAARYQNNATWTPRDLAERLGDRESLFDELDDGTRSVYAAFRLSYDELSPAQRDLLVYLAPYPSAEFDAYVAGALAGLPMPQARRLLEQLQTGHLVDALPGGRFHCHDLVRSFAAEASRTDVTEACRNSAVARLLDYALLVTEQADLQIAPGRYRPATDYEHRPASIRTFADLAGATAWLDAEWPALCALVRLAAEQGLHDRAWRLAFLLRGYFMSAKLWDVWVDTHTTALRSTRAAEDHWAEAVTLNNLGIAHIDQGDVDTAEDLFRTALPLFRELGDEHGQVTTLSHLAWAHYYRGDYQSAQHEFATTVEFYRRTGADRNAAITMRGIALVAAELGDYPASLAHATDALAACQRLSLPLDATMALNCLGWTYFRSGQHDLAAVTYRRALESADEVNSRHEAARALTGLGNVAAAADDVAEAQHYWDQAEERYPELNTITVGESRARHGDRR